MTLPGIPRHIEPLFEDGVSYVATTVAKLRLTLSSASMEGFAVEFLNCLSRHKKSDSPPRSGLSLSDYRSWELFLHFAGDLLAEALDGDEVCFEDDLADAVFAFVGFAAEARISLSFFF